MTGDTTPISDEAVRAFTDRYRSHFTVPLLIADDLVADALAAARPLLVSAEAERLGRELAAAHRMIDARGGELAAQDAVVEGLRAELARAQHRLDTLANNMGMGDAWANPDKDYLFNEMRKWIGGIVNTGAPYGIGSPAALRAAGGQEKPTGEIVCREHNRPGRYCSVDGLGCDGMERADAAREAEDECEHRWDSIGPHRVCTLCDISATSFYGVPFDEQEAPAAAPVGGQAEPSDVQIEAAYSVGYAAMRYDSATWFDSLRKAVPDMLRAAAAAVSGPPSWDQVMERVGQRRLLRAIELSADCTCPPGPLPATYDGPMPVCAIHPPTLEEAHELIDRLRAAAPVGGQAEPSDDLGEAAAHALLGQQVEVVIEREREGKPPVIVSGQLLAFSNDGEILTRQEDGSVWSSWPRLEVRAAAAVSGEQAQPDGETR